MPMTPTRFARAAAITSRGLAGPSKNLRPPGESSRFAMHCTAAGAGLSPRSLMIVSGWPMPRQSPGADDPLADKALEDRPDIIDKGAVKRHALGGVGPAGEMTGVGHDIRVQEEQVEARQAQPAQTVFDRA